jgi:putative ABC transport system permease protein
MVVANLVHRPLRSLISIVAIAVEVTLILVIVGLSIGMLKDAADRQRGIGADIMVQPPGSSNLSAISGAPTSIKLADILRKQPHVTQVAPVITQLSTAGALEVIYGIDPANYPLGAPFRYLEGGPFEHGNDILVDDYYAKSNHVHAGQTITTLDHATRVAGVVEQGKGARKFLQLATLQDWIDAKGRASIFYVKLDDPKNVDVVTQELKAIPGMEGFSIRGIEQYVSMMTMTSLPGLSTFIKVVIGVAVIIGFIVIFQAMYTAVMERTREIGILKSLGASKLYIVNVILRETVLLTLLGIALGIAISYAVRVGIHAKFPLLPILITRAWILYSALIAVVGSLLGAIYPAIKAARKDPIDALAYE